MNHKQVVSTRNEFDGRELGAAERSEAKPCERPSNSGRPSSSPSSSDNEVRARSARRRFTPSYKARIAREAALCSSQGELGALLRQEGLYSSQLCQWRREYARGGESALESRKRGRKPLKTPLEEENERLRVELERAKHKLHQAEIIIEFQKNLCEMLDITPAGIGTEERG